MSYSGKQNAHVRVCACVCLITSFCRRTARPTTCSAQWAISTLKEVLLSLCPIKKVSKSFRMSSAEESPDTNCFTPSTSSALATPTLNELHINSQHSHDCYNKLNESYNLHFLVVDSVGFIISVWLHSTSPGAVLTVEVMLCE